MLNGHVGKTATHAVSILRVVKILVGLCIFSLLPLNLSIADELDECKKEPKCKEWYRNEHAKIVNGYQARNFKSLDECQKDLKCNEWWLKEATKAIHGVKTKQYNESSEEKRIREWKESFGETKYLTKHQEDADVSHQKSTEIKSSVNIVAIIILGFIFFVWLINKYSTAKKYLQDQQNRTKCYLDFITSSAYKLSMPQKFIRKPILRIFDFIYMFFFLVNNFSIDNGPSITEAIFELLCLHVVLSLLFRTFAKKEYQIEDLPNKEANPLALLFLGTEYKGFKKEWNKNLNSHSVAEEISDSTADIHNIVVSNILAFKFNANSQDFNQFLIDSPMKKYFLHSFGSNEHQNSDLTVRLFFKDDIKNLKTKKAIFPNLIDIACNKYRGIGFAFFSQKILALIDSPIGVKTTKLVSVWCAEKQIISFAEYLDFLETKDHYLKALDEERLKIFPSWPSDWPNPILAISLAVIYKHLYESYLKITSDFTMMKGPGSYIEKFGYNLDYCDDVAFIFQLNYNLKNEVKSLNETKISSTRLDEIEQIIKSGKDAIRHISIEDIDSLDGVEFENVLAVIYKAQGYRVETTKASGDQGVDLVLYDNSFRYAVQAKRYSDKVSNTAIQEVVAGMSFYGCQKGIVVTSNYYTDGAKQLAKSNGVTLVDRDQLVELLRQYPVDASAVEV